MPVIVVGADAEPGGEITRRLLAGGGEVRAFITDPGAAEPLRRNGARVAVGDVTDASHLAGAAAGSFAAVLVTRAAVDPRERAFATDAAEVLGGWVAAVRRAGVRRVIWVAHPECDPPHAGTPEQAVVRTGDRPATDVVADVLRLEEIAELP